MPVTQSRSPRLRPAVGAGRARRAIRRREPEEKRARLLDAARRLFAERGYAATTTARSSRGRRRGRRHRLPPLRLEGERCSRPSPAEYGRGLAEHMFAGVVPSAALALGRGDAAAGLRLRARAGRARRGCSPSRPIRRSGRAARSASRREIVSAPWRPASRRGAQRGVLRPLDPRIAAELLFALVEAALTACFVRGDGSPRGGYLRETVRLRRRRRARAPRRSPRQPHTRSPS